MALPIAVFEEIAAEEASRNLSVQYPQPKCFLVPYEMSRYKSDTQSLIIEPEIEKWCKDNINCEICYEQSDYKYFPVETNIWGKNPLLYVFKFAVIYFDKESDWIVFRLRWDGFKKK